jgi:hypothetical protein
MTIRRLPRGLAVCAAMLLALPAAGRAAEPAAVHRTRVDLALFFGAQHYKMGDLNAGINAVNAALQSVPGVAGTGFKLKDLKGGGGVGGGIRVWPRENLVIEGDWMRLTGASTASVPLSAQPGAPALKGRAAAPGQSLGLTVGYFFFRPLKNLGVGVGAGGAYYICDGEYEFSFPNFHERINLHGTGFGAHGLVLADLRLSNIVHLEGAAGYRLAKTGGLKNRGVPLYNADGSEFKADYSGLITRFGLDIPFGPVK